MGTRRRTRGSHHRRTGYPGQPNEGLDALLGNGGIPGTADWRTRHGDKVDRTLCVALRAAMSLAVQGGGRSARPVNVYPCQEHDYPGAAADAPLHWHVGHRPPAGARRPGILVSPPDDVLVSNA